MVKRLIKAHTAFIHQHPQFPLLNFLQDDITQMQSDQVKKLPKSQQGLFCISLLWLMKDFLASKTLSTSALGAHIDDTLKTLTCRVSTNRLLALQTEYAEWRTMEHPHASPTSVI